tara:strand:+ start:3059 stop:3238 length:180 start_codon:yes stop_codon:yes gene_type:complete
MKRKHSMDSPENYEPEQNVNEILCEFDWETPTCFAERAWVINNKYEWGEPFETPYYMDK